VLVCDGANHAHMLRHACGYKLANEIPTPLRHKLFFLSTNQSIMSFVYQYPSTHILLRAAANARGNKVNRMKGPSIYDRLGGLSKLSELNLGSAKARVAQWSRFALRRSAWSALLLKRPARAFANRLLPFVRRRWALAVRRFTIIQFAFLEFARRYRRAIEIIVLISLIAGSAAMAPTLQTSIGTYFNPDRFAVLRNLFATIGGALIGATAIGFSVVMIAVQLNFARIPQGLFRKLSSDFSLLGAFAATFLLAVAVSGLSLIPDAHWSGVALIVGFCATLLILILFFYGYRRSLALISPQVQLELIIKEAQNDLARWTRRAKRMAPLLEAESQDVEHQTTHDLPRLAFFQANPQWTVVANQALSHSISFARRYAEEGDYEVSANVLNAVVGINAAYVGAKGRTFFAPNPIFENSQAPDGFINKTLEDVRQALQTATARGEEGPIRQLLATIAALVRIYMAIDYAAVHRSSKHHAQLAASYLASGVEAVVPRGMPDVVMEGVRLMGGCAQSFLAAGVPNDMITLKDKIVLVCFTGAIKPEFRPVTLVGMEQLARITRNLLLVRSSDIGFAADQVRNGVELVAQVFLQVPDAPLQNIHSTYLAPYYALTSNETLGSWLTTLCNAVMTASADDENARIVVRNVEICSKELYRTQKPLMLLAIEKRLHFTFDILHWVKHIAKLLTAVAMAPATEPYWRDKIERHVMSLISVLSWIPEDNASTSFVENFSPIELMFEIAIDASSRNSVLISGRARQILLEWTFKAGRNGSPWRTLKAGVEALVVLVLIKEEPDLATWFKSEINKELAKNSLLESELLDDTARELRIMGISFQPREFEFNPIHRAMGEIRPNKLRALLTEIADQISPGTATEPGKINPFW
jgi:hypothetical protein